MTARRYAEDTKVSVGQSQGEIRNMLKRFKIDKIGIFEDPVSGAVLMFEFKNRAYRITVPVDLKAKNLGQEERRGWRLMVLLIKAKLQAVSEGVTSIDREFFSDTVLPSGKTLFEEAQPQIDKAMENRGVLQLGYSMV